MKIGFNCSTFDLFHAGHVTMLKLEKNYCDYLIVAIQTDPTIDRADKKNKPIQSLYERFTQVSACKYVDEVVVYATEKELLDVLQSYPIDVRILGIEYANGGFSGSEECACRGIEIVFNERSHSFSSSNLRKRVIEAEATK
mgnify:CR=1 FL=1